MPFPSAGRLRRILILLFFFAEAHQIALSIGIFQWLARAGDRGRPPFPIVRGTNKIHYLSPSAVSTGLRPEDELLSIDGQPYAGRTCGPASFVANMPVSK